MICQEPQAFVSLHTGVSATSHSERVVYDGSSGSADHALLPTDLVQEVMLMHEVQ